MKRLVVLLTVFTILFAVAGCKNNQTEKSITVSAAVSMKAPLEKIAESFYKEKNIKINFNFGSSGTLQKQIEEGAPVDVFISAGKDQMDRLQTKKLIDSSTRKDILKNALVLVSPHSKDGIKKISELGSRKITLAIGETKTVPVGQYAKESLEKLNLWEKVSANIVYGRDASDVLKFVQKGEVQAGVIYESDTISLDEGYTVIKLPEDSYQAINYPAAVTASSSNKDSAKAFLEFIKGSYSSEIFKKYKFKVEE
jgi:molybdate transport system substrate-binding protein